MAVDGGDRTLLGVGGEHLRRAQTSNRTLAGAPTLPAARRYTGVVWDHLDVVGLAASVRRRAGDRVAVVSGLHGLVMLQDPVPDYRLKMAARLAPLGLMSTWWRPAVTEAVATWARRRVVVDLLPKEHRAAWQPDRSAFADLVQVDLVELGASGGARVVGHEAKAAKGLLARHLLLASGDPRRALETWTHPRFSLRFDPPAV